MPSNKKKGKKTKKEKIAFVQVDFERIFDTLYDFCRNERRKELSLKAQAEFRQKGRGIFVVDAFLLDPLRANTDIEDLYNRLEWWTHERCVSEPMPEYTATDPYAYDPEIYSYLHGQPTPYGHRHNPEMEVIIAMVMRQPQINYGTTTNTMGMWRGENSAYVSLPPRYGFNPYEDKTEIGNKVHLKGVQCSAADCDNAKVKGQMAVGCEECGATAESCKCVAKVKINTLPKKGLMKCGQCGQVSYCSRECQKKDWKAGHKVVCKQLATQANAV